MTWRCAIEDANRPANRKRCDVQCESCKQEFLARDDGRPVSTCETFTGLYYDFDAPQPDQIELEDIAHHLAQRCRFACATKQFYSVAEHALFVRGQVIEWGYPNLALAALHHDSHEFMLGDWPTPLKRKLRAAGVTLLDEMAAQADEVIARRFGIDVDLFKHPVVKEADTVALYREASALKRSRGVGMHWSRTEPADPIPLMELSTAAVARLFIYAHNAEVRRNGR